MSSSGPSKGPERATEYVPKYVNIDDVPIGNATKGIGEEDKRLALKEAEGQLETDVNGGDEIDDKYVSNSHWGAVRNLVSFILHHPAVDPRGGINLSQVEEYGSEALGYTSKYLERYNSLVSSINATDEPYEDGSGSGGPGETYRPETVFETF